MISKAILAIFIISTISIIPNQANVEAGLGIAGGILQGLYLLFFH